ncbi:MAG: 1-acyl-sn-glycerol-3-phosphate acyltransferase [Bacilli bacterium]|nr:1-acyl-sn-glycerol-3-phosphate acyltransferase [Bacilli bacterium]
MYNFFLNYLKSNNPEDVISSKGIKIRKTINPILRKVAPLTGRYKLQIDRKAQMPSDRPIIYAPTHGFKDDLLYTIATIDDHAYVLFGSLPQFYNTFDGISAWLNGSIIVDREDKESRKASKHKMEKAINLGSNLILFPEGVWNKTQNLLVLKLYPGIYDVAKKTNALVAPVATHIDGDTCYSILDDAFDIYNYDRKEGLILLRDKMATLKWELMEKHSHMCRSDLDNGQSLDKQWNDYINTLIAQVKYYDYNIENKAHYQDKNEVTEEEVFQVLDNVELTRDNARVLIKTKRQK